MIVDTDTPVSTHFAFRQHTRQMRKTAIPAAIVLLVSGSIIALAFANALPQGLAPLVAIAFVLAVISFIMLVPLLIFFYEYNKGGIWLDEQGVRVRFPAEDEQRMLWSEALYAVDEGDEYLALSKGKEGLGHLVGREYYVRLHLEGLLPEQRADLKRLLTQHVEIRQPHLFTFITLLQSDGESRARGRLYLFEHELLCAENRNKKRVFIAAPLHQLDRVWERDPFYVGRLAFEAFCISYAEKEFVVMLGYETTLRGAFGTSSSWVATGSAREWVAALRDEKR